MQKRSKIVNMRSVKVLNENNSPYLPKVVTIAITGIPPCLPPNELFSLTLDVINAGGFAVEHDYTPQLATSDQSIEFTNLRKDGNVETLFKMLVIPLKEPLSTLQKVQMVTTENAYTVNTSGKRPIKKVITVAVNFLHENWTKQRFLDAQPMAYIRGLARDEVEVIAPYLDDAIRNQLQEVQLQNIAIPIYQELSYYQTNGTKIVGHDIVMYTAILIDNDDANQIPNIRESLSIENDDTYNTILIQGRSVQISKSINDFKDMNLGKQVLEGQSYTAIEGCDKIDPVSIYAKLSAEEKQYVEYINVTSMKHKEKSKHDTYCAFIVWANQSARISLDVSRFQDFRYQNIHNNIIRLKNGKFGAFTQKEHIRDNIFKFSHEVTNKTILTVNPVIAITNSVSSMKINAPTAPSMPLDTFNEVRNKKKRTTNKI